MRKLLLIVPIVAACSEGPSGPNVKIQVAPLELPGVGRVCYDLAVENGDAETVWSKGDPAETNAEGDDDTVCSDRYGNSAGGDVTYIGTCDASAPEHTVRLWVDTLESSGGAVLTDWVDPCPDTGCALEVTCVENADTLVEFNLTLMRRAQQGFFDVAVNFEDIFCSAKVDCTYDDAGNQPIELLFRDGDRAQTAVIGFACSAGPDETTHLIVSPPFVDCDGSSGAEASIVMNSWPNGDLVGYEVVPFGAEDVVLQPTVWPRTANGWGTPSLLPIPGYNSAVPHSRVGDDRIIGEAFDTDGGGEVSSIVLWRYISGAWEIEASAVSSALTSGVVSGWDPVTDRVFLGNDGIVNSYWDLSSPSVGEGPRALPFDHDACGAISFSGDNIAVSCYDGGTDSSQAFAINITDTLQLELPDLLDSSTSQRQVESLVVLSDGSIVGVIYAPADGVRALHHWHRAGNTWSASLIGPASTDVAIAWRDGDYVFVTRDGESELHLVDGAITTWTAATLDGSAPDDWTLQGAVELDGDTYVYGLATTGGEGYWAAGVLTSGGTIALHALPAPASPDDVPLYVLGHNDGKLWVTGVSTDDAVRVVWQLDAAEPTLVADWRVVEPGLPVPIETLDFIVVEGPPNTVATFGGIDGDNRAFGFAPFASGTTGGTVQGQALASDAPVRAGGQVALDPTVDGNGWELDENPLDPVWQYAAYRGAEQLRCGTGSCNKLFWNFAVGFEPEARNCTLRFVGTAMGSEFFAQGPSGEGLLSYPYVNVEVQLTDEDGAMVCRRNPLDGEGSGVTSMYTSFDGSDDSVALCFGYDGQSTESYCGF